MFHIVLYHINQLTLRVREGGGGREREGGRERGRKREMGGKGKRMKNTKWKVRGGGGVQEGGEEED